MPVDELDYFGSRGSSSRAKKLAAALRISLARLSSRFSRSNSRDPLSVHSGRARTMAAVDLRLPDPIPQCLAVVAIPAQGATSLRTRWWTT